MMKRVRWGRAEGERDRREGKREGGRERAEGGRERAEGGRDGVIKYKAGLSLSTRPTDGDMDGWIRWEDYLKGVLSCLVLYCLDVT